MPPLAKKYQQALIIPDEVDEDEPIIPVKTKPVPKVEIKERLIHLLQRDNTTKTVKAKVVGSFGVHVGQPADGAYCVTHIPTQRLVTAVNTEQDAFRIVQYLMEHAKGSFNQVELRDCVRMLPKWVKPWVESMRETGKWEDPAKHKK